MKKGTALRIISCKYGHQFPLGSIVYTTSNTTSSDINVTNGKDNWNLNNREWELLNKYRNGDIVLITDCTNSHRFDIGEFVRIINNEDQDSLQAESLTKRYCKWWINEKQIYHIKQSENATRLDDTKTYEIFAKNALHFDAIIAALEKIGIEYWRGKKEKMNFYPYILIYPKKRQYSGNDVQHYSLITLEQIIDYCSIPVKPEEIEVQLKAVNNVYQSKITKDKIEVGCQSFNVTIIKKLEDAYNKVKG